MARGQVTRKTEAEHGQEIHERRRQRHGHHGGKTDAIHQDGLTRLKNQEPDRRDDEQVTGHGDQSPAMPPAKLPGDRERGGTHELRLGGRRRVPADVGDEDLVEGRDAFTDTVRDRKSTRLNSSHGYISYAV